MNSGNIGDDARGKLEDAGLSILMEEFLGIEEARLRGEALRLNSDADFLYPEALDETCRREIDRHFAKEKRRAALRSLRKIGNAAAVLLAVAALGWAALFSGREPERAGAFWGGIGLPFEFMFTAVFVLMIGIFLLIAVRGLAAWSKNNAAPRLAVEAVIVAKRAQASQTAHPAAGDPSGAYGYHSRIATSYRVTFQVESGDRMEFSVPGSEYGLLAEGDYGRLYFQGTRFLSFERG